MNYFTFKEFTRESVLPTYVADAILKYHLPVLNLLRDMLGEPIYISERSGYRSVAWEKSKGRSGTSQHTFINQDGNLCKGAVDVTCHHMYLQELGYMLVKDSDYTRICWYPSEGFYHCDYKKSDHRVYNSIDGKWARSYRATDGEFKLLGTKID